MLYKVGSYHFKKNGLKTLYTIMKTLYRLTDKQLNEKRKSFIGWDFVIANDWNNIYEIFG